uniref:Uncharacterized protein n=1 Tax=Neurospora crassa TaxID=5141 RepID=O94179_NEUCS|nr:unknown [Neurospora crassa]
MLPATTSIAHPRVLTRSLLGTSLQISNSRLSAIP